MESRATKERAGAVVNGDGVVDAPVVFDGIANGVLGSGDSAGLPNTFAVAP